MDQIRVESPCPMCKVMGSVFLLTTTVNVPYFGDGMESTMRCDACGFRHADFMILGQKDPLRLTFAARSPDDLAVRVIRSNSGTVRVPELGFLAEPTALSESYVSNVEGVLERVRGVMMTALEFHGDDAEKRALLEGLLKKLERMMSGLEAVTIQIDDPFGNSAIISEDVVREDIPPDVLAELKTGTIVIDAQDL